MEPDQQVINDFSGATRVDWGVIAYVCGHEDLSRQVRDPRTYLVVTRRDESAPLVVKLM